MTVIYQQNIRNCYLAQGIMKYLPDWIYYQPGQPCTASITIYSGAQPTASTIESNWANYNTTYLLHLPNAPIQQPTAQTPGIGVAIINYGLPPTQLAANTGIATWAILWLQNIDGGSSTGQIGNTVLPSVNFMILPVSDLTQTYPVRFSDTSITSGVARTISDINILATGGIA
jgi:hypothetical protein